MKKNDDAILTSKLLSKILILYINRTCGKFPHADQSIVWISYALELPEISKK